MESRTVQWVIEACEGLLCTGDAGTVVRRVCTDSRRVETGDLFVPLRGERFDGHQFVDQALAGGAAAVLLDAVEAIPSHRSVAVVSVANTRRALGAMAARYRQEFSMPVVAVAGSNGKTTTKDLVARVLEERGAVHASVASYNNDIGVPLTLLGLESGHRAAVVEAGTNHPGELRSLLGMIRPDWGVLTSLGSEHLEFFGSLDGVVEEEGTLAEWIPPEGTLFLGVDGPGVEAVTRRCRGRVVGVGWRPEAAWRALEARVDREGTWFRVEAPSAEYSGQYRVQLLGRHQVNNALLALAVGAEFGLSADAVRRGLAACLAPPMRMRAVEVGGVWVLEDCYNANADSMRAALDTLRDFPCGGRRAAVLGDMGELGAAAAAAHAEVGQHAAVSGVELLVAVGRQAEGIAEAARSAGLEGTRMRVVVDPTAVADSLMGWVAPGDVVLFKASRFLRMERAVAEFRERWVGGSCGGEPKGEREGCVRRG